MQRSHFIWFSENRLSVLADQFIKQGGKYLFLDEVHKYRDWSVELKNIYHDYPDLQIVFTGSSLLEIGGKNKEISPNISCNKFATYFALDDIESGHRNQISL